MAEFIVQGGNRLKGEIVPQGAKNEALQIICATLLTPERVTLHNVPEIVDILQLMDMLRAMGVEVEKTCWPVAASPICPNRAATR